MWDEAENIRRERQGLPPLEPVPQVPPKRIAEDKPILGVKRAAEESAAFIAPTAPTIGQRIPKPVPIRSSKQITNIVIVALALVFAGVAYLAIHMSKGEAVNVASKDYIPAPVEKPQPVEVPKRAAPPTVGTVTAAPASVKAVAKDSLQFVLRATQPVWVSIAPDGIPAYRGELKTGEVRSFRASDKIVVNIGNQRSVVMTFDGAPLTGLPPVQNSNVVIRDLVLTRDRVMIGGNTVDLHKLPGTPTSTPIATTVPPKPPPAVKAKPPIPLKKATPAVAHKAPAITQQKGHPTKPVKGKKSQQKSSLPPLLIHPVEPIPPRP